MSPSFLFISAGAGSGKTYRLTELLHQRLTLGEVTPAGVIATTFTIKAAAELRERVRTHLISNGQHSLATQMGQARIGTVNSVCGNLLTRFAFEAGLPPQQRVLDEAQAQQILNEAIDQVSEGDEMAELLQVAGRMGLTDPGRREEIPWLKAFKDIVNQARSNAIGPKSLSGMGEANASQLLALLPKATNRDLDAALRSAITAALPDLQQAARKDKPVKKTRDYVDLCEDVLRALDARSLRWSQWCKLEKDSPEAGLRNLAEPIATAAAEHSRHPRLHADVRTYLTGMFRLAAAALDIYARRKRALGAVDFVDQERALLDVLEQQHVAQTLREELQLLMVDEFQDTSPIQLALFLRLAQLSRQVVWVGDVKQAIYGFRGGDATLMQAVIGSLSGLDATVDPLLKSYRSRPALVAWVNELFGSAFAGLQPADVRLQATRQEFTTGAAVEDWQLAGSAKAQYAALAAGIASLVGERTLVLDRATKQPRPVRLGDIAVLARSKDHVKEIATVLRERQILSATNLPGLLGRPEIVLARACLRRLNDERDTLATAEIVSLAGCEDPDAWLSDRLAWINDAADPTAWRDNPQNPAHPIFEALQGLRVRRPVLSPREAVELVVTGCGLSRQVLQWQTSVERGRMRLANLDRLLSYASEYEEDCRGNREAATLSGFLLWLQELGRREDDTLPQSTGDAVQVMTHHAAKGLEWPVVILVDLAAEVKDATWNSVCAESRGALDAHHPLQHRQLRYWPWPYGAQERVPVRQDVGASPLGLAIDAAAVEENRRLLYVSLTRARDLVVLARAQKKLTGPWMDAIGLGQRLPGHDAQPICLTDGTQVPFRRRFLDDSNAVVPTPGTSPSLRWYAENPSCTARVPLLVSPSASGEATATVIEEVPLGSRITVARLEDRSVLGEALHACIAADIVRGSPGLPVAEVQAILQRYAVADAVSATEVTAQLDAIRRLVQSRWPGAAPCAETPVTRVLANGQRVAGRIDLLLRTATGWVLFDHKSTSQGQAQWAASAARHAGQLAAYRDSLEAVTGLPVEETWLLLPVAAAAVRVSLTPRP